MKVKSMRIPEDIDQAINYVSQLEKIEKTQSLRKLARLGFEFYVAKNYRDGRISLRNAADLLNLNLSETIDLLAEAGVPAKISVGITAIGQGTRGGGGVHLAYENPIPYIDDVAVAFPNLDIIAAHCPWPFHNEMIAVLVHKANVYNELHGWSPRHFPAELKREINGRLQDKFMFGSDYPLFTYERLFKGWESEGYKPEVLEKVFIKNTLRIFEQLGIKA